MSLLLCLLCSCAGIARESIDTGQIKQAQTFVFQCPDNFSFIARTDSDTTWLFLPGRTVKLAKVRAAPGNLYSNGSTSLRMEGDIARLEFKGVFHTGCLNNRQQAIWEHAKLGGVDFRGVGNEPGWYLEIRENVSILFVTGYREKSYLFEKPERISDPENHQTIYRANQAAHRLRVTLSGESCRDSMADEIYATRVLVELNGKSHNGCGRALH